MSVDVEKLKRRLDAAIDLQLSILSNLVAIQTVIVQLRSAAPPDAFEATKQASEEMMQQSKFVLEQMKELIEAGRDNG